MLKPCPFCGGKYDAGDIAFMSTEKEAIVCLFCGVTISRNTRSDAIKAWNTRPADVEARIKEVLNKHSYHQVRLHYQDILQELLAAIGGNRGDEGV